VLRRGIRSCDAVLISAGSSVGNKDLVPTCIDKIGEPGMIVHGIAMRPSLATGLAVVKGKPTLSLPGFPVSAIIAFRIFGRPLISRVLHARQRFEPVVKARLNERISGPHGYRTFVRVSVRETSEGLVAQPLKLQRSSALVSIVASNGIVTIPENVTALEAGELVDVTMTGEVLE